MPTLIISQYGITADSLDEHVHVSEVTQPYCERESIKPTYANDVTDDEARLLSDALDFDRRRPPQSCSFDVGWTEGKNMYVERYTPDTMLDSVDLSDEFRNFELISINGKPPMEAQKRDEQRERFDRFNLIFPQQSKQIYRIDFETLTVDREESTDELIVFYLRQYAEYDADPEKSVVYDNSYWKLAIDRQTRRMVYLNQYLDDKSLRLRAMAKMTEMTNLRSYQYIPEIDDALLSLARLNVKVRVMVKTVKIDEVIGVTEVKCPVELRTSCHSDIARNE